MSTQNLVQGGEAGHWDQAIYAFLSEKERRSGSMRTVKAYSGMLYRFFGALGKPPDQVTATEIFGYAHDLDPILERFGNRGYRLAQLEASITAGKIYLAAYSQRLGATGLTFYDDEVTRFFSPHAEGKSVMFLVALGQRARRRPVTLDTIRLRQQPNS